MPADALTRWDRQQAAYIAHREQRFTVMLEVLELLHGDDDALIVDLACGPGSLAVRLLERFPHARVIGIDRDRRLLDIAATALAHHGDRLRLVDADLTDPGWTETLNEQAPRAVVSTTALHWLTPPQLVDLYRQTATLLPPGGILLNGDHLRFDDRTPTLKQLAAAHDDATQRAAFAAGAQTWQEWWSDQPPDDRDDNAQTCPPTAVDFHVAALTQAGFAEVGTVWQYLDDYVVFARR